MEDCFAIFHYLFGDQVCAEVKLVGLEIGDDPGTLALFGLVSVDLAANFAEVGNDVLGWDRLADSERSVLGLDRNWLSPPQNGEAKRGDREAILENGSEVSNDYFPIANWKSGRGRNFKLPTFLSGLCPFRADRSCFLGPS